MSSVQIIADHLAVAIKNARLSSEARQAAVMRELRPTSTDTAPSEIRSGVEDVRAIGLKAALHRFANMLAPQSPTIRLDFEAYRQQDPSLEEGLFLICREALSNAIRHSGAHRVEIRAAIVVDELVLSVIDNGSGFDERRQDERATTDAIDVGIGLQTMRERAAALGALCEVHSQPGHGTSVTIRLPLAGLNAEMD